MHVYTCAISNVCAYSVHYHCTVQYYQAEDNNLLRISPEDLASYWERQEAGLGYKPHGFGMVPLGIYGDDARFTKGGDKIVMISLNAVLHEPTAGEIKRYPIFTLREYLNLGNRSLFPVCRVLAWSVNAARRRSSNHSILIMPAVYLVF